MPAIISALVLAAGLAQHWQCVEEPRGLWHCQPTAEQARLLSVAPKTVAPANTGIQRTLAPQTKPAPVLAPKPAATPRSVSTPAPAPQPQFKPAPAEESGIEFIPLEGDYIVQVGAFLNLKNAERYAGILPVDQVMLIPTWRDSQTWYVLILGKFTGYSRAREAGERYLQQYPEGSVWVRDALAMRALMIPK